MGWTDGGHAASGAQASAHCYGVSLCGFWLLHSFPPGSSGFLRFSFFFFQDLTYIWVFSGFCLFFNLNFS